MSLPDDQAEDDGCLCRAFVPEPKRVDYQQVVTDDKTGKRDWKTVMRAHQDCPHHGIKELVVEHASRIEPSPV